VFEDVKFDVAVANRILSEAGLATGHLVSLGHISQRVPGDPNRFIVKGRGYELDALTHMKPSDMVVCDLDGNFIEGPPGSTQCYEVKMHSCVYRTYPDVQSVVHVHPRFIVLMTVLQHRILPMCQEGMQLVARPLPVYEHTKIVQSDAEGMEVATLMGDGGRAVLLRGHGACTSGRSMEESFMNMYHLEEQARMNWYAYCAEGREYPGIPEALVSERQIPRSDLPHFATETPPAPPAPGAPRRAGGVFGYFQDVVIKKMKAEGLA
jgi:ribulose-5-phosphate 4-epimerase/fuculose-1-phosphate aldolase